MEFRLNEPLWFMLIFSLVRRNFTHSFVSSMKCFPLTCTRLASDSDAADEKVCVTFDTFSIPTPNVDTNFLTKFSVCGDMQALLTAARFSNATA